MADWIGVDMPEPIGHKRRPRGTGGLHFRTTDGMWIGTVDLGWAGGKRNRRRVANKSREVVEAKMAALLAMPVEMALPRDHANTGKSRSELIAEADKRGTHTVEQWLAKRDAVGCCVYCGSPGPLTVDHATPLARGGSNGIDNVVPACSECNSAKAHRTAAEFIRERLMGVQ